MQKEMTTDPKIMKKVREEQKKHGIFPPPKPVEQPKNPWPWCLGTDTFWKGKKE